jgi:hypothetical protein
MRALNFGWEHSTAGLVTMLVLIVLSKMLIQKAQDIFRSPVPRPQRVPSAPPPPSTTETSTETSRAVGWLDGNAFVGATRDMETQTQFPRMPDYWTWSYVDLKCECKRTRIDSGGLKVELIGRLVLFATTGRQ